MTVQFLSYLIEDNTPSYGNQCPFDREQIRSMARGDTANTTVIKMIAHLGTHIDMPFHFYQEGQTIEDYSADFWVFKKPQVIEINAQSLVASQEVMEQTLDPECDLLLVKTGLCHKRDTQEFWERNIGFAPEVADFLRGQCPKLRAFAMDSISMSSFQHRDIGREAHLAFLKPESPILIIEDVDLREVSAGHIFDQVVVAPLRIAGSDGLSATIMAFN